MAQLLPLLSAATALEDLPKVMAGKLNWKRHIPEPDRAHGPNSANRHRFLLIIDPEHGDGSVVVQLYQPLITRRVAEVGSVS